MEWIRISSPFTPLREYNLIDAHNLMAVLKYNPVQQSARISAGEKKQLFFIERSGFRNTKMILENEYGVQTGLFQVDKFGQRGGDIKLNDRLYHFKLLGEPVTTLTIYEHAVAEPVASCSLAFADLKTIATFANQQEYACLLLGLCWYLFSPYTEKDTVTPVLKQQPPTTANNFAIH